MIAVSFVFAGLALGALAACDQSKNAAAERSAAAPTPSADPYVTQQASNSGRPVDDARDADRHAGAMVGAEQDAMASEHQQLRSEHSEMRREHANSGMQGAAQDATGGGMNDDQMPMDGRAGSKDGMMAMDHGMMGKKGNGKAKSMGNDKMGSDKAMPMEDDMDGHM